MHRTAVILLCFLLMACDARQAKEGPSATEAMSAINDAPAAESLKAEGLDPRWSGQVLEVILHNTSENMIVWQRSQQTCCRAMPCLIWASPKTTPAISPLSLPARLSVC